MKKFDISYDTVVITSTYVTAEKMPLLYISHDFDEEEGDVWQFHCGNGDYTANRMQLVRLETIINLDPTVIDVADLPVGYGAKRLSIDQPWIYAQE
ncbi:hypothetical protein ACO0K9_15610 [Undibacterium sp. Ji50W]|uniref:hypothetical protein n=1 Tax=Undibacterium sp. Ji50W TaxID=3413041 RepID=UPI003BF338E2